MDSNFSQDGSGEPRHVLARPTWVADMSRLSCLLHQNLAKHLL